MTPAAHAGISKFSSTVSSGKEARVFRREADKDYPFATDRHSRDEFVTAEVVSLGQFSCTFSFE